ICCCLCRTGICLFLFFFFQAEDGIRDGHVTGVQTCALPICPWQLSFQPDRGAPPQISLEKLVPWQESTDEGVRYFSGTGTYTKSVQAASDWFKPGAELWIDLGEVKNLAEVSVNGKPLGILWKTL